MEGEKQFKKYQWIRAEVSKQTRDDPRPESYKIPNLDTLEIISDILPTKNNWEERKNYVFAKGIKTMCELQRSSQRECSLGIIHPRKVDDLKITPVENEWNHKWEALAKQENMFESPGKPLEKIPFKFSYRYYCDEINCKGHEMMITDWELFSLYRKVKKKLKDDNRVLKFVKEKFLHQICGSDRDTHFFVGTVNQYGSWIVIGTFWPPVVKQQKLPFV